jgi:hypothetical protein
VAIKEQQCTSQAPEEEPTGEPSKSPSMPIEMNSEKQPKACPKVITLAKHDLEDFINVENEDEEWELV